MNYYQIRYRTQAGPGAWQNGTAAGIASSKNIVGLSVNTTYEWQIRAICNPSPFSTGAWSGLDDFNTLSAKETNSSETSLENEQLRVYPNPAQHTIYLDGTIPTSQELNLIVRDMNGRKVKVVSLWAQAGDFHLEMNVHDLSNGVYSLEISGTEWHKNISNILIAK
ncbi:MAG: T9SS type A sorting domain-containing protein [Bacteroidota bacterium]|nr:MAG: T9SS type A sorting domain-containing protein [Bacteroidota bacterium]